MKLSKEYRNIYLASLILMLFVAFMAQTTYVVVKDVASKRFCASVINL